MPREHSSQAFAASNSCLTYMALLKCETKVVACLSSKTVLWFRLKETAEVETLFGWYLGQSSGLLAILEAFLQISTPGKDSMQSRHLSLK